MRVIETDTADTKQMNKTESGPAPGWQRADSKRGTTAERLAECRSELSRIFLALNLGDEGLTLKAFMDDLERNLIIHALTVSAGVQKRAATLLRVKPTALSEKIKKYGIIFDKDKENVYRQSIMEAALLMGWRGNSENVEESRGKGRSQSK